MRRRDFAGGMLALGALWSPTASAAGGGLSAPLSLQGAAWARRSAELRRLTRRLAALDPDPAPAKLTNDKHYLVSNERRFDLYRPHLPPRGGVYLGVGADQNYIMAGVMRPEVMVLVDFDESVVALHGIYRILFSVADDAAQFVSLWSPHGAARARRMLSAHSMAADRADRLALYDEARPVVAKRLAKMSRRMTQLGIDWLLTVPEQYDYVHQLCLDRRVVALRGDFTLPGVVRAIGRRLADADTTVRVLYLSNIEQYFMYQRNYRRNMLSLPFDDDTMVLRTLPGRPAGFQYIAQAGTNFHAWLRHPKTYSVYRMRGLGRGEHLQASEGHLIDRLPRAR